MLFHFQLPDNWEVLPRTPVSSFKEGVTFEEFDGRNLKMHVRTKCFAIGGNQTNLPHIGCGKSPAGSYFQVRFFVFTFFCLNAKGGILGIQGLSLNRRVGRRGRYQHL